MTDNILALSAYNAFSPRIPFSHTDISVLQCYFSICLFATEFMWFYGKHSLKYPCVWCQVGSHCLYHQWGKWPWEDRFLFQVEYGAYCHLRGTMAETVIRPCFSSPKCVLWPRAQGKNVKTSTKVGIRQKVAQGVCVWGGVCVIRWYSLWWRERLWLFSDHLTRIYELLNIHL